jgi:protease-4
MKRLFGWLFIGLCTLSVIVGFLLIIVQKPEKFGFYVDKIAVLNIYGHIKLADNKFSIFGIEDIIQRLNKLREDSSIKALVLRVDSGGGSIGAVEEIYRELKKISKAGKKIVVSVGNICASGAYYIATAADKIIANPSAIIGSIGALFIIPTAEELLNKIGIKFEVIKSSNYKDIGSFAKSLSPEERRILQDLVDKAHLRFVGVIKKERKLDAEKLAKVSDGRIFLAKEAIKLGLIDGIGGYSEAIDLAKKLAKLEKKKVIIVEEKKVFPPLEWLFSFLRESSTFNKPSLQYVYLP